MARQPPGYDLWLTAANRVYRAVPYDVLTDWLQQGRIVAEDRVRPDGGDWRPVAEVPAFAAFLPRAEPDRADDRAEAFEPVGLDVPVRRRPADEDDDVDMIPLIDISLVLLIFFMMTATVAVSGANIETPQTYHGVQLTSGDPTVLWVGIDRGENGGPVYSLGQGDRPAEPGNDKLTQAQVLERLDAKLKSLDVPCTVRVAGHKKLPFGTVQALTAELEKRKGPRRITEIKAEVNERSS
jgi:biopolymer transport protein ExbD